MVTKKEIPVHKIKGTPLFIVLGSLLVISLFFLGGCATVMSDNQYPVEIKSTPDGATFNVSDRKGNIIHTGTTPEIVTLYSGAGYFTNAAYKVLFEKEEVHKEIREMKVEIDEFYFANVTNVLGFFVGDPAGAMYELPDAVHVFLKDKDKPIEIINNNYRPLPYYRRPTVYRTPVVAVQPVAPYRHPAPPVVVPEIEAPQPPIPQQYHQAPPPETVQQIVTPLSEKVTTHRTEQVDTIEHSELHFTPCNKEAQPCTE